ncbi:hypothetical protein GCM10018775_88520 [Streptomyces umbrinus]|nr:hypothetical protein GCM10018775_88520 [Streptomyces umbrinus]
MVAVASALDDPVCLQLPETQSESLTRGTGVDLNILEAMHTEAQLPHDEQTPPLAHNLK